MKKTYAPPLALTSLLLLTPVFGAAADKPQCPPLPEIVRLSHNLGQQRHRALEVVSIFSGCELAEVKEFDSRDLAMEIWSRNPSALQTALDADYIPLQQKKDILIRALEKENLDVFAIVLRHVPPTEKFAAADYTQEFGMLDALDLLIDSGIDGRIKDYLLYRASLDNQPEVFDRALAADAVTGFDISLPETVTSDRQQMFETILASNPSMAAKTQGLKVAAWRSDTKYIDAILESGITREVKDDFLSFIQSYPVASPEFVAHVENALLEGRMCQPVPVPHSMTMMTRR